MPPPGFTMIDNDAVIRRLPEIDGTAIKVYLAIARRADASGCCWPSVETIGGDAGIARRAVQLAIGRLVAIGLLAVEARPGMVKRYRVGAHGHAHQPTKGAHQNAQEGRTTMRTGAHHRAQGGRMAVRPNNTQEQDPLTRPIEQDPNAAAPRRWLFPPSLTLTCSRKRGDGGQPTGRKSERR